jgi:hypothetical protein
LNTTSYSNSFFAHLLPRKFKPGGISIGIWQENSLEILFSAQINERKIDPGLLVSTQVWLETIRKSPRPNVTTEVTTEKGKKIQVNFPPRDRCHDFQNIFAEKFCEKIGVFDSKQS